MAKNMETGIMWGFMKCVDFSLYLHAARGNEGAQKEMETTCWGLCGGYDKDLFFDVREG